MCTLIYVRVGACVPLCLCEGQRTTCGSLFSPSITRDPGIEPRSKGQAPFPGEASCGSHVLIFILCLIGCQELSWMLICQNNILQQSSGKENYDFPFADVETEAQWLRNSKHRKTQTQPQSKDPWSLPFNTTLFSLQYCNKIKWTL